MKNLINNVVYYIVIYTIIFCSTWIFIHTYYYICYSGSGYTSSELIIYAFKRYIGYYTATMFTLIMLGSLTWLYFHANSIIQAANNRANKILAKANSESDEIKTKVSEYIESEYVVKNRIKSRELEAIRQKLQKLKF